MASKLLFLLVLIFFCYVNGSPTDWVDDALESWDAGIGEMVASEIHSDDGKHSKKKIGSRKKTYPPSTPEHLTLEITTPKQIILNEENYSGSGSEDVGITNTPKVMGSSESGSKEVGITNTLEDVGITNTPEVMDSSKSGLEDVGITGTPAVMDYSRSGAEDMGISGTPAVMDYSGSGAEDMGISGTPAVMDYSGSGAEDMGITGTREVMGYSENSSEDVGITNIPAVMSYSSSDSADVGITNTPVVMDNSPSNSADVGITNTPEVTPSSENDSEEEAVTNTLDGLALGTTVFPVSDNDLETVTGLQGILTEMETNKIIEKKIIEAMNEFSSNCNIYNPIKLSVKDFTPPSLHRLRLDDADAIFTNLRIKESDNEDEEWKNYSTTIGCDSSNTIEIQVSVPPKIIIAADIHIIDSSDEIIRKGTISLTAKGVNIMKQYIITNEANDTMQEVRFTNNSTPVLTFEKSEVALSIDMAYQIPIYLRLNVFLAELKPLQDFYANQLRALMKKNGISLSKSCSKIFRMEEPRTPTDSWNTDLQELYVIPDVKFETWKGQSLSAGPILIDGLLNFNRTEFMVVKPERRGEIDIIRSRHAPQNKVVKRIKTEHLRGKFEWEYRLKKNVLPFTIDYVDFESIFIKSGRHPSFLPNNINKSINVKVGKVEVQASESKACENENHFANFILSGYLQSLIEDKLKNSIQNKLLSELSLSRCNNF